MKSKSIFSFIAIFCAMPALAGAEMASHRAIYDIDIRKSTSASTVKSITGRTAFLIQRHCDGWQSVEDYAIAFGFEQGQSSFISHYETWESANGKAFSFSVHENSTNNGFSQFTGFANLNNGRTEAYFIDEQDVTMELPEDTIFPISHMQQMLEQAQSGRKFQQSTIFLGGDHEDALYKVSTVVGARQDSTPGADLGQLADTSYWPLRIAYFRPDALESEPDYEIEFRMQDNGVIRSYIVDYGEFSMRGKLMEIEPLLEPTC